MSSGRTKPSRSVASIARRFAAARLSSAAASSGAAPPSSPSGAAAASAMSASPLASFAGAEALPSPLPAIAALLTLARAAVSARAPFRNAPTGLFGTPGPASRPASDAAVLNISVARSARGATTSPCAAASIAAVAATAADFSAATAVAAASEGSTAAAPVRPSTSRSISAAPACVAALPPPPPALLPARGAPAPAATAVLASPSDEGGGRARASPLSSLFSGRPFRGAPAAVSMSWETSVSTRIEARRLSGSRARSSSSSFKARSVASGSAARLVDAEGSADCLALLLGTLRENGFGRGTSASGGSSSFISTYVRASLLASAPAR
mmetsp:Transcript_3966/g.12402  ORF Transcript_3966/g.12402 Transcript_3966/m.12402 type:complete len:326 (-) Transcript_3966:1051-2028(-)